MEHRRSPYFFNSMSRNGVGFCSVRHFAEKNKVDFATASCHCPNQYRSYILYHRAGFANVAAIEGLYMIPGYVSFEVDSVHEQHDWTSGASGNLSL